MTFVFNQMSIQSRVWRHADSSAIESLVLRSVHQTLHYFFPNLSIV